jgi:hypothetical protein
MIVAGSIAGGSDSSLHCEALRDRARRAAVRLHG